ncbi:NAD(P)-binding domain-containing protein [Streptomyces sp. NPDC096057]|uniref:NAD(P)-binding domain-containing protein n=1 Tax=Streptomyces sp. NPDC096057 TaxID=3155543 RepID=UPI0033230DFB
MGTPLCGRFVSAGHRVTVSDLRPEREEAVRSLGANWAPSVKTAACRGGCTGHRGSWTR